MMIGRMRRFHQEESHQRAFPDCQYNVCMSVSIKGVA